MTPASAIGFLLVFVVACVVVSGALVAVLVAGRSWLSRQGPAVERRAAELVAAVPVAAAVFVVAVLAIQSLLGPDHCTAHAHHAHLCLVHGTAWVTLPWAVAAAVVAGAVGFARGAIVAGTYLAARRTVARLAALGQPGEAGVLIVPSERAFCFVAGIRRPAIYASTRARAVLPDDEWRAMIAHEASHVRHRDLARRGWLELMLVFAAPLAGIVVRELWLDATERLRDADAAGEVGDPAMVASALVQMSRLAQVRAAGVAPFTSAADRALARRVEALLDGGERGEPVARRLARRVAAACTGCFAVAAVFAEPLHHALETLLG